MTYTYAIMEISQSAYDEIATKMRDADYGHAFGADGEIDMHGIAVMPIQVEQPVAPSNLRWYVCPTCDYKFHATDERFCPKCHEREHTGAPV